MMSKETDKKREQVQMMSMDEIVPHNHLLRDIERAIDFSFIYDLVKEKYSEEKGKPSLDPIILIKIVLIQYLYGIKSMRQTVKDIEVTVAYRWFLRLTMYDPVPHFSTFGKNYSRRFKGTDLFEQIFTKILDEYKSKCYICKNCPYLSKCTNSKEHVKLVFDTSGKNTLRLVKIYAIQMV